MKTILGLIGSPRKGANSEIIIKQISSQVPEDHTLKLLRINDFDLKPCLGCYQCLFNEKGCIQKDDFEIIANAMAEADAWILAVPTYVLSANASLKRLLDRGLGFFHRGKELWKKPAIGVSLAGMEGKEGYCKLCVDSFLRLLMADTKASVILFGALPGEVLISETNQKAAKTLGEALFGDPLPMNTPHCGLCGGDTFRFLDNQTVRCMTCSNAGGFQIKDGLPVFDIQSSGHDMFLTESDAKAHKEWLQDMKRRFLTHKDELKVITQKFKKTGEWVKP